MMNGKNSFFDMDMSKAFQGFSLPGLDTESVMASQRKNMEAFTQANQLAVEGVQAVTRRQAEFAREAFEGASAAFREFAQPGSNPSDHIAKQVELTKQAFEKTLSNARELGELLAKANAEAFEVMTRRFTESLDEIREQAKARTGK
jgi:phasin family protein